MYTLTVILKNDEGRYTQKFLMYDPCICTVDDPTIHNCIAEAKKMFVGVPDEIKIRIAMEIV